MQSYLHNAFLQLCTTQQTSKCINILFLVQIVKPFTNIISICIYSSNVPGDKLQKDVTSLKSDVKDLSERMDKMMNTLNVLVKSIDNMHHENSKV